MGLEVSDVLSSEKSSSLLVPGEPVLAALAKTSSFFSEWPRGKGQKEALVRVSGPCLLAMTGSLYWPDDEFRG